MISQIKSALLLLLLLTIITGIIYPLATMGISLVLFPTQAKGSLITVNDKIIGSSLIGQNFSSAHYFHPRPSAAGKGYDPMAALTASEMSTSIELVASSRKFQETIKKNAEQLQQDFAQSNFAVPIDLLTHSASGLDPDITPAAAIFQAKRVAAIRGISEEKVLNLIQDNMTMRQFGILGEARVNVLALNLMLDKIK